MPDSIGNKVVADSLRDGMLLCPDVKAQPRRSTALRGGSDRNASNHAAVQSHPLRNVDGMVK